LASEKYGFFFTRPNVRLDIMVIFLLVYDACFSFEQSLLQLLRLLLDFNIAQTCNSKTKAIVTKQMRSSAMRATLTILLLSVIGRLALAQQDAEDV
jgi:hypothetical protein